MLNIRQNKKKFIDTEKLPYDSGFTIMARVSTDGPETLLEKFFRA